MYVLFSLLTACVSQEKYQAALDQNQVLQDQVSQLQAKLARRNSAFNEIMADLKPLVDKGVLKVENKNGRVTVGMASDILFASGSAELSDSGKGTLAEVGRILARRANEHDWQVEGHTDSQPIATDKFPDNNYLGAARSINVMEYLVSQGFPKNKISAATMGDSRPVADNGSDSGRAQNRRIELVLMTDLGDLGGPRPGAGKGGKGGGKRKN